MASAMIHSRATSPSRNPDAENQTDDDNSDVDDFDEDGSISSLPSDDDDDDDNGGRRPPKPNGRKVQPDDSSSSLNGADNDLDDDDDEPKQQRRNNQQSSEGRIYRMMPLPKLEGTKPYHCEICQNSFQQKKSVYRHIKEVHKLKLVFIDDSGNDSQQKPASTFPCHVYGCDSKFPNKKLLARHHSTEHNNNISNNANGKRPGDDGSSSDDESAEPPKKKKATGGRVSKPKATVTSRTTTTTLNGVGTNHELDLNSGGFEPQQKTTKKNIPYRCIAGECNVVFQSKVQMITHISMSHRLKLLLVKESVEDTKPGAQAPNKKFNCGYPGCESSFTRKNRRREHIAAKHPDFVSFQDDELVPVIEAYASSSKISKSSSTKSPVVAEINQKPQATTFPKKYACDYPGCDKAYTKSSHVKRHKLAAHERDIKVPPGPKTTPTLKVPPTPKAQPSRKEDVKSNSKNNNLKGGEFACGEVSCESTFSRRSDLTRHTAKAHKKS